MRQRKDIYLENFEQLCPLVGAGWVPLYPVGSNSDYLNILLIKELPKFQENEAEGAAADAVGTTCLNCEYEHSSPLTNTICFSNQGVPENITAAVIFVSIKGIEV